MTALPRISLFKATSRKAADRAQSRADLYKHLMPEWPALWRSFQATADRITRLLAARK